MLLLLNIFSAPLCYKQASNQKDAKYQTKLAECGIVGLSSKEGLWIATNGREEEEEVEAGKEMEDKLRTPPTLRFAV